MRTPDQFWKGTVLYLACLNACAWGQTLADPELRPEETDALSSKAVGLYQQKDFQQACLLFEQVTILQPANPVPHLYLLGCAIRQGDARGVVEQRMTLDRLAPAASGLNVIAGDWLAAGGFCKDAEQEYALAPPGREAGVVEYDLAQCNQAAGNRASAIIQYRKALELDSNREEHYSSAAILLIADGQFEEAGQILAAGVQRFPSSIRLLVVRSLLLLDVGYSDEARTEYEKARALAPDSPTVWKVLGLIQRSEGDYPNAVKSFERAAAIDGKDAQTYLFMGLAQLRIAGGTDAALADFLHALQINPGLVEARFEAASIYLQSKDDARQAIAALDKVVAAAPNYAQAYRLLVQAYQRLGSPEKADAAARKYRQLTAGAQSSSPSGPR
ncbi:MAG: tetratricopeptide repeat protein [Bryobacteraceae bacterium]